MIIILDNGQKLGPFKSVVVGDDRLHADDQDLPFSVIGGYTLSEDDSLIPVAAPAVPVPEFVAMWQGRDVLIEEGLLDDIYAFFDTIGDDVERAKAISKFNTSSTIQRDDPLVRYIVPLMGKSEAEIDQMFIRAAAMR